MDITNIKFGTIAIHQLGDISREPGDYFFVESEDDHYFYGMWLTGFGFANVRFPKDTVRELTQLELEILERSDIQILR